MKQNSFEFKVVVANSYNAMKENIQDETFFNQETGTSSRFRRAALVLNREFINKTSVNGFLMRDIHEEVLEMISVDLKTGYNTQVTSMEVIDHQARDWLVTKLEEFSNDTHPWCIKLKENKDYLVVCTFCFGSLEATKEKDDSPHLALLPVSYLQLIDYKGEEGDVLEVENWNMQEHGVLIQPDVLKQFGRPPPDISED